MYRFGNLFILMIFAFQLSGCIHNINPTSDSKGVFYHQVKLNNPGYNDNPKKMLYKDGYLYVLSQKNIDEYDEISMQITKVDISNGEVIWETEYSKADRNYPVEMVSIGDGFVVGGLYINESSGVTEGVLFYIDDSGVLHDEKERVFKVNNHNVVVKDLDALNGAEVAVALSTWDISEDKAVHVPVIYNINTRAVSTIDIGDQNNVQHSRIIKTNDGNVLFAIGYPIKGRVPEGYSKEVYKINLANKKVIWKNIDSDSEGNLNDVIQAKSGIYILTGQSYEGNLFTQIIGDDGSTKIKKVDDSLFLSSGRNNHVATSLGKYVQVSQDDKNSIPGRPEVLVFYNELAEKNRLYLDEAVDDLRILQVIYDPKFGYILLSKSKGKVNIFNISDDLKYLMRKSISKG